MEAGGHLQGVEDEVGLGVGVGLGVAAGVGVGVGVGVTCRALKTKYHG